MKLKKLISAFLAVILAVMSSAACFAEVNVTTTETHACFDIDLGSEHAGENLIIEIFKPNKGVGNITSTDTASLMSVLGIVYQEKLDEEGKLSLELVPGDTEGWYSARVGTEKVRPSSETIRFPFSPASSVISLVDELAGLDKTASASLKRVEDIFKERTDGLLSDYEKLGLPETKAYTLFTDKDKCTADAKKAIYRFMLNRIPEAEDKAAIQEIFEDAVYIETVLNSPIEKMPAMLEENAEILGYAESEIYKNLYQNTQYIAESEKADIAQALAEYFEVTENTTEAEKEQKDKDKENISEVIETIIFLTALANRESDGEADAIISAAEDLLTEKGAEIEDYKELENPEEVWTALEQTYESIESFIEDLNDKIEEQLEEEDDSKGSSGGSKGSGSSGGSKGSGMKIDSNFAKTTDKEKEPVKFSDLENVSWAEEGIYYLAEKGIVNGKGDGVFDPSALMKREEFVKILVLSLGIYDDSTTASFEDVKKEDWFYSYVASGEAKGLIQGADGLFGTGEPIRREDVAVLLLSGAEALGKTLNAETETVTFTDEGEIAEYAKDAVAKLSGAGIINGLGDGNFAPKSYATRAEIAKMIYTFLKG